MFPLCKLPARAWCLVGGSKGLGRRKSCGVVNRRYGTSWYGHDSCFGFFLVPFEFVLAPCPARGQSCHHVLQDHRSNPSTLQTVAVLVSASAD